MKTSFKRAAAWLLTVLMILSCIPALATESVTEVGEGFSLDVPTTYESSTSYDLYVYTLIPGMTVNSSGSPDSIWNGMGVGTIAGVSNPANIATGNLGYTQSQIDQMIASGDIVLGSKKAYGPDLTYDGKTYKLATTPEQELLEGYYTVEWIRLVNSPGANTGNNNYNPAVASSRKVYHLDGQVFLNMANRYTVTFRIKEPDGLDFVIQDDYSKIVESGTSESILTKPSPVNEKTVNGITYVFDGWYYDEECTSKCDFTSTIESDTNYYGRYIPKGDSLDEYYAKITVKKTFSGLSKDEIPVDFKITLTGSPSQRIYELDKPHASQSDDGLTWTWQITGQGDTTYSVMESGQEVEGYTCVETGTGSSITISPATINSLYLDETNSNKVMTFPVNIEGDTNNVFVATLTNQKVVVLTSKPLNLNVQKAIQQYLNNKGGTWAKECMFLTLDGKTSTTFEIDGATFTYANGEITFLKKSNWSHVGTLTYSISEAAASSDLNVTNTYTRETGNFVIRKTVVDDTFAADETRAFSFTIAPAANGGVTAAEFANWATANGYTVNAATGAVTVSVTVTQTESGNVGITSLDKLPTGTYTVTEVANAAYTTKVNGSEGNTALVTVYANADAEAAVSFENTRKTETKTVKKVWVDFNNLYGKRPANVTVALIGKTSETAETASYTKYVTISGENEADDVPVNAWTETVTVPTHDPDGTLLVYSLSEAQLDGYLAPEYSTETDGTLVVTNRIAMVEVTLRKLVTGTLGDRSKEFTFIVSGTDKENQTVQVTPANITLKHSETATITVPVGTTLTIKETNGDGYTKTYKVIANGETSAAKPAETGASETIDGPTTIEFTNHKDGAPDTGVVLDSLPYIVILAIVLLGVVLMVRRRRREDD